MKPTSKFLVHFCLWVPFLLSWTVTWILWLPTVNGQSTVSRDTSIAYVNLTEEEVEEKREASANLSLHLENLAVSKRKIAPVTVSPDTGELVVDVNMTVVVCSVLGVNDAEETMTTVMSLALQWRDKALAWNTSDYAGVEEVRFPVESVWIPEIFIANSLDFSNLFLAGDDVSVTSDGSATAVLNIVKETMCQLDLFKYPKDIQTCSLFFVPIYPEVTLTITGYTYIRRNVSFRIIGHDNQWSLEGISSGIVNLPDQRNEVVEIRLILRRKSLFYLVCLLMPMILTSYLNTMVFLLPLQSGEKFSFLVSLFVSTSVFIGFFKDVMPRGLDTVPATMQVLLGIVIQTFLIVCLTILVMRRFHREEAEKNAADIVQKTQSSKDKTKNYHMNANTHETVLPGTCQDQPASSVNHLDIRRSQANKVAPSSAESNLETLENVQSSYRRRWGRRMGQRLRCLDYYSSSLCGYIDAKITAQFLDFFFFCTIFTGTSIFLTVCLWDLVF